MRSALKRDLRRGIWACVLGLGLALGPGPTALVAQVLEMTRSEALELARALYLDGDQPLANAIARRLIEADPHDVEALLILSASEEAMGNPQEALVFGRRAWEAAAKAGRPQPLRYEIARQTAHAAMSGNRNLVAQLWLRRALTVASLPEQETQTRQDLEFVQANAPLQANLAFQITPTTNLNGGSNTDLFMVDDVIIGGLQGWSEAQPGLIAVASLDVIHALPGARDRVGLNLTEVRHMLTPGAAAANPDLDARDLDQRSAVLRYEHDFVFPALNKPARLTFSGAQSWTGPWAELSALGLSARSQVEVSLVDRPGSAVMLTAIVERQWQESPSGKVDGLSLGLTASQHVAPLGATLQFGLTGNLLRSAWSNTTYDEAEFTLGFIPDAPVAGINWSLALTAGAKYFPIYALFSGVNVTDGRQDFTLGTYLTLEPESIRIGGMSPFVTLSQLNSWSNVSRNDTRSLSVSLGLAKEF